MLSLKNDVRLIGIRPETLFAVMVAESVFRDFGGTNPMGDCMVTSCTEGQHSAGSLHYVGCAVDLRINHIPSGSWQMLRDKIAAALGGDFDVLLEQDHVHIEFQPKAAY